MIGACQASFKEPRHPCGMRRQLIHSRPNNSPLFAQSFLRRTSRTEARGVPVRPRDCQPPNFLTENEIGSPTQNQCSTNSALLSANDMWLGPTADSGMIT